jgi:hypothetical protein
MGLLGRPPSATAHSTTDVLDSHRTRRLVMASARLRRRMLASSRRIAAPGGGNKTGRILAR